jgi:hypothetical protein
MSSLAKAAASDMSRFTKTGESPKGASKIFEVEHIRKPAAAPTGIRTIPVSEHVQRIKEHNATPNNTTTTPASDSNIGRTVTEEKEREQHGANQESMDTEEDDNEGYDIVGRLSKVYPTPKPSRKHMIRYDLKVDVVPSEATEALAMLSSALLAFWTILKDVNKKLVIYPWKDGSIAAPLQKIKDMPEKLPDIARFFDKAFPRKAGGTTYASVYFGHEKSFKAIHEELEWWLANQQCGMYPKALQCERSMCIGWLLYSTLDMDREQLADDIPRTTGTKVGLRFPTIWVNSKQKLLKEQMVPAIHIEIDKRNYAMDRTKIAQLYESKKTEGFPLGIKMKLCPQVQDAMDPATSTKFDRVRIRHASFLANVTKTQNYDIGVLDFADPLLNGSTLQKMIMNI